LLKSKYFIKRKKKQDKLNYYEINNLHTKRADKNAPENRVSGYSGSVIISDSSDININLRRSDTMKYKYINIKQDSNETFEGYPLYRVYNNKNGSELAQIFYDKDWKRYVFTGVYGNIFDDVCLGNIIDFIKKANTGEIL